MKHDWPRTHATQPELYAYANRVVDRFGPTTKPERIAADIERVL